MDPDLWKQVDALLDQAMAQPPDQREAFVIEASKDNAVLRDEVLSLLKAQAQATNFMERSAMRVAAESLAQDSNLTTSFSLIGRELANYKIEKLIGAGGMGEVYLARDSKLDRLVALKILPWHFVADTERSARFQREARALSALNHPNLVTIYEVGEAGGIHFIAIEYVEGQTLSSSREKLGLRESLALVAQVAEGLAAAHQAGLVHRDIKPENVMVRPDGYAKVLDFGLVKLSEVAAGDDGVSTQVGVAMGTLAYMSPEQASGEPVDHRTDIWSLGVLLYELVTSHKPFKAETRQATINAILSGEPKAATAIDATLPPDIDLILQKALEKDRELRYQTASDFRADIRRLMRMIDSAATISNPKAVTGSLPQIARRSWFWPIAIAAVIVITAIPLIWYLTKTKTTAPDWSRASHLQLTNQAGTEFFPTLAPDGEDFVFSSEPEGNFDLFLQRVGGKNARPLTPNTPSDEYEASYSPDGKRIAFYSNREPAGVYLMEATGENVRPLVARCHHPAWSPNGKEIVCSRVGHSLPSTRNINPSSLVIADVESGAQRTLCENDAMQPSWSPNGSRIAFWFNPPSAGRSDIATIARTGGEIEIVTRDASTNWNPVWSPDGKFLYFASDRTGNMSFWRVPINEANGKVLGEPEAVSTPATFNRHLNFSRNGKRLIYVQTDRRANIQAVNFDRERGRTVGEPYSITRGDNRIVRPELSPDGSRFVMRLLRGTQEDIVVVDRDGTNWRDLTTDKFFDRYPRWSPDGKRIAFTSDRSGRYEIWTIDADGTNLRQLTFDSPGDTTLPLWSPDGTRLLIQRSRVNVILDLSKDWSSQTLPQLPKPDKTFVAWDWSRDGKTLIGTFTDGQIGYYSFETNRYEKAGDVCGYPMWIPDSTGYICLTGGKAHVGDVAKKGLREILALRDAQIQGIAVSRDGQFIYFSAYSTESDIWLLDLQ
ncbi:MAG TPA: protein kinase [Pyrinomonadaceae bacterium]|nr:protein kinase [Pyrinomonadaceae bacterium]